MVRKASSVTLAMVSALLLAATPPKVNLAPPPRITTVPPETFGDWSVIFLQNGASIASTSNNAGSVFGVVCDRSGCTAFLNPKITCENGHRYPALINAPAASFSASLTCEKLDDKFIYNLPLEGSIADAMSVGGVLGVAFPMESGEFKVARFSLTGAARASARAQQMAQAPVSQPKQPASDNFSL